MEWHERAEVQRLKREWYGKLREDGFVDIEQDIDERGTPGARLLGVAGGDLNRSDRRRAQVAGNAEYYRQASIFSHYLIGLDKAVWSLHAEGWAKRDIADRLADDGWPNPSEGAVGRVIAGVGAKMRLFLEQEADQIFHNREQEEPCPYEGETRLDVGLGVDVEPEVAVKVQVLADDRGIPFPQAFAAALRAGATRLLVTDRYRKAPRRPTTGGVEA